MRLVMTAVMLCVALSATSVSVVAQTESEIVSHIKAGLKFTKDKDHERALVEFRSAASGAHTSAGWALYRLQRFSEAALEFERAIYITPGNARYYRFLGMTYRKTNQLEFAEKAFKEELHLSPSAEAYLTLGRVYLEQGREQEAKQLLEAAAAKYPENSKVSLELSAIQPAVR